MTTVSDINTPMTSGNATIDGLLSSMAGYYNYEGDTTIYYTFATSDVAYTTSWKETAMSSSEQSNVVLALAEATEVTGIKFAYTSDANQADFFFGMTELNGYSGYCLNSYNYYYDSRGNITWFDIDSYIVLDYECVGLTDKGETHFETLLHEIGHALGLEHPWEGSATLATKYDNNEYTVMSYTDTVAARTEYAPYDIAALKYIYGTDGLGGSNKVYDTANLNYGTTGTTTTGYTLSSNGKEVLSLYDMLTGTTPSVAAFEYYEDLLDAGNSLTSVANTMMYWEGTDQSRGTFLTTLWRNILGYAPSSSDISWAQSNWSGYSSAADLAVALVDYNETLLTSTFTSYVSTNYTALTT